VFVTVQGHERGRVRLEQNDCLQGEKGIRKERSDLSYLHNIHKVRLFTKNGSHMIVPSQCRDPNAVLMRRGGLFHCSCSNGPASHTQL
jgi:hypothetical protein